MNKRCHLLPALTKNANIKDEERRQPLVKMTSRALDSARDAGSYQQPAGAAQPYLLEDRLDSGPCRCPEPDVRPCGSTEGLTKEGLAA